MMSLFKDFSLSTVVAGFVAVLVGFTSSAVLVFQAAATLGASPAEIGSWMGALGLGTGLTSIVLSLRYRIPVLTAWSTPGAAMLITSAAGVPMAEAIGAFLVCAALIIAAGFSGAFERAMNRIPVSLAAGMLAGVLLRFGLDVFVAMQSEFAMTFTMFCVYLLCKRLLPRYAVVMALAAGTVVAATRGLLHLDTVTFSVAEPVFVMPHFSLATLIGVALPLFVVTMASQNIPGVAAARASGYALPISTSVGWTGVASFVLAPFGGYAMNLAAITAAICMGKEAHEDPAKRYTAAVSAGVLYVLVGIFGATVAALFAALPRELVLAIAGLALFGTIGNGLAGAVHSEREREAALITFLVTASGASLFGIGSAFWGIVAGMLALLVQTWGRRA